MDTNNKKFDINSRTFETRVLFIRELFTNKYEQDVILTSSIQYKLGASFENYLYDLQQSVWRIYGEDPMAILKRIDK